MITRALAIAALGLAAGYGCRPEPSTGASKPRADAAPDAPPDAAAECAADAPAVDIDLLLVVGNGPASADAQQALAEGIDPLLAQLECDLGARPNLHVGVVSTDLGAGGFDIPNCAGGGDAAALENEPRVAGCQAPGDPFIVDRESGGGRETNYSGSLGDAVRCIAALGQGGCAFEQPAAAAIAATDPANLANQGFLRPGALLAVIFAADADDCSAADTALFDPDATALGPLGPFRCFEHGVECDPDEPRAPGVKSGCAPREDSALVTPVADLAADLEARAPALAVAVVGGIDAVVVKDIGSGQVELESSCAPSFVAAPPVRLGALAATEGGLRVGFCSGAADAYRAVASAIAVAARQ